eukprot:4357214-Amphidinium_carterae.1
MGLFLERTVPATSVPFGPELGAGSQSSMQRVPRDGDPGQKTTGSGSGTVDASYSNCSRPVRWIPSFWQLRPSTSSSRYNPVTHLIYYTPNTN